MALKDLLNQIDSEIARLQQARFLLAASETAPALPAVRRGRPKKDAAVFNSSKPAKKRNLSPEGRARIAEAVKRRWASQKAKQKSKA